ncbi:helix-turn-helix domain-containing protein, partial [Kitasatospora sp. NPDC059571]|uniref:helix-turn-helix domain-containing protein n=1 Tax=Kitasatospora sp. NPDC059571 TaxID=3346871 RepID=UPI0036A34F7D
APPAPVGGAGPPPPPPRAASLPLLEAPDGTVEEIAAAVGFESAATFRHHFGRTMRTSPTAYRRTFGRGAA